MQYLLYRVLKHAAKKRGYLQIAMQYITDVCIHMQVLKHQAADGRITVAVFRDIIWLSAINYL